jgi:O-antigen/teichoic acid export membrane protein
MNYEIDDSSVQAITRQFIRPRPVRWLIISSVILSLLLLLVILASTVGSSPLMVIMIIAAPALLVGAIMKPRLALQLIFIGAGFPALLLPLPGHNMRPVEAGLWVSFLVIVLWRPHLRLRLPHLLALVFLVIAALSFIHVPQISTSLDSYTADKRFYEVLLMILAFFCGSFMIDYVKDTSSLLVTVLLCNVPIYLIALLQALKLQPPAQLVLSSPALSEGRLPGPFTGAVGFGIYLINLFAIALACWLLSGRRRDRMIGVIMLIATSLAIIASGTRSVAIAAIVVLIIAFILTRRFKLLFIVVGLALTALAIFANKIIPLFTHDPASSSNRLFLWQEAIKLIGTHIWIGIGLWQFPQYYGQLIVSQATQLNAHGGVSVHEQYLEWGMESGIFWLVIGLLLLLSISYVCWRAYRLARREQRLLLLATLLAVIANTLIGFFDVPLDGAEGAVFLFLMAGLAVSYAERIRGQGSAPRKMAPAFAISRPQTSTFVTHHRRFRLRGATRPADKAVPSQSSPPATMAEKASSSAKDAAPSAQKTGRSVFIQLISWVLPIPLVFPMTALLTRYLGPVQYGEYSFTLSFLAVVVLLSGNGIDPLILRQLSHQPRAQWGETLSYAIGTRLLAVIAAVLVTIACALLLPMTITERALLILGSFSMFFSFSIGGWRSIFETGFRAEQRISMLSLIVTIDRLVTAGLVGLIVWLRLPLLWACFIILYSDLPFFLVQAFITRRRFGVQIRLNFARAVQLFLSSLPLIGYNIMALIAAQADLLLLMALAGAESVGLYALASRITDPLLSIVLVFTIALYPLLCAKYAEGREQFSVVYHETNRILALVIIPLAIFVSVEARPIVILLGGQHFAAATVAVQLLMWAMAATFFNQLCVRACMAAHLERRMMYITLFSSSINIVTNLILIPHWQIVGAGLASLLSELVALSLFTFLLRRHIHIATVVVMMVRVVLGNLPMLFFLIWQYSLTLWLSVPLALLLTIAGGLVMRTFSFSDIQMLWHLLSVRRQRESSADGNKLVKSAVLK